MVDAVTPPAEAPVTDAPGGAPMASEGASPELLLGLREAAAACGVSVSTMRRRRHELLAMGATAKDDGWQIPPSALVAIGMLDKVNGAGDAPSPVIDLTVTPPSATPAGDDVERLRREIGVLREDLRDSLERAARAEGERDVWKQIASTTPRAIEGAPRSHWWRRN